jgi:hypothetical protein
VNTDPGPERAEPRPRPETDEVPDAADAEVRELGAALADRWRDVLDRLGR